MKKVLLSFLFCFSLGLVYSQQFTITPDPLVFEASDVEADNELEFHLENTSSEEISILWQITYSEDCQPGWLKFLCDANFCYTPSVTMCPVDKPNLIAGNETSNWIFHISPLGNEGCCDITIDLFNVLDPTTVIQTIEIGVCTPNASSSVEDLDRASVRVYPNPTVDFIQITDDEDVDQIGIYNIVGKQIKTINHTSGQKHDIGDLRNGMYLVQLRDNKGETIKVVRLSKKGV